MKSHLITIFIFIIGLILKIAPVHASIAIQVNPVAFFEQGYDVAVMLKLKHWRYGFGLTQTKGPELISEDDPFTIESKVLSAHVDYFTSDEDGPGQGFFLGPSFHRVRWIFFHPPSGRKVRRDTDFLGPQVGYVYRMAKNGPLFFQLALAFERNIQSKSDLQLSGAINEIPDDIIIPSFVVGVSF